MAKSTKKNEKKLDIRQRRIFSEEFKRSKIQLLIGKQISIPDLAKLYNIHKMTVYRWLYKYSPHYDKGTTQIVQMESEQVKTKAFQQQVAELERIVGQKQMQIDFLEKMIDLASAQFEYDIKKNFNTPPSSTSEEK